MQIVKAALAGLTLSLASGLHADAATLTYATEIDVSNPVAASPGFDATTVSDTAVRSNPGNALGAPNNGPGTDPTGFYSLGLGGIAVLGFGGAFSAATIFEVTFGCTGNCSFVESADVYAFAGDYTPFDGTFGVGDLVGLGFSLVGSISNSDVVGGGTISLGGVYRYLAFVDTSPVFRGRDGIDFDAIGVTLVPVPAGGLLLIGAVGALGALGAVARTRTRARRAA